MTRRNEIEQLTERDRKILYEMNNLRFVTMEQFRMISGYGKSYTFEKSREYQRVNAITSKEIIGSDFYQVGRRKRQGKYLSLTHQGMKYLFNHGYEVTSTAQENKNVRAERLLAILKTNDLALGIKPFGWHFLDGRDAKRRYKTDIKNALLHGLFIPPSEKREFGFYMLMSEDNERTVDLIKQQTANFPQISNIMIATRTPTAVQTAVKQLDVETLRYHGRNIPKLQIGGKLIVLPIMFALIYLPISKDNVEKHKQFLESLNYQILVDMDNHELVEKNNFTKRRFDYVVRNDYFKANNEHNDFYLVDMLDNDLTKLRNIANYSDEEYQRDGRKVIVLTTNQPFHKPIHELYIMGHHFIFHTIKAKDVNYMKNKLYSDVVVPERTLK